MQYAEIIVPFPLEGTFTYRVPAETEVGMRVLVPFGKSKTYTGVVYKLVDKLPEGLTDEQVKDIDILLDTMPTVTAEQLRLWTWMATYYLCPIGDVLKAALPAKLKAAPTNRQRRKPKNPKQPIEKSSLSPLSPAQYSVFEQIKHLWQDKSVVLLHGVTASGKTEVYQHLIQEALDRGEQVLYMVPEIALTTQLTERLEAVFGDSMSVYHSRFTDTERADVYQKVLQPIQLEERDEAEDAEGHLVLGARSSIFLPFKRLGLIIVDEEHDGSYKQTEPNPRYHARNTAIVLAQIFGAKVLLGTATPAVETYYNAQAGKYGLVELTERYTQVQLPEIQIIDTKEAYRKKQMTGHFADELLRQMQEQLERGKQIIVFQNRRGWSPYMECPECAYIPKCTACDVSLTVHQQTRSLVCHYCGYTLPIPRICPSCGSPKMSDRGAGTEKLEDELQQLFPNHTVARMDLDTTRKKQSYQTLIDDFAAHKIDILVGTQMLTKGLHFKEVSLVAVLQADALWNKPDFRATETAYQMLEQVSGRAGRDEQQGKVIIQTSRPETEVLQWIENHDYSAFYKQQIEERQDFHYPPFYTILRITLRHRTTAGVDKAAEDMQAHLRAVFGGRCSQVTTPVISKVQNLYIRQILLKIERTAPLSKAKELIREVIKTIRQTQTGKSTQIIINQE